MSTEENKAIIRRVFAEGVVQGNLDTVHEIIDPTYINHSFPGATGPEGIEQVIRMFRTGFEDFALTIEDIIAEGDKVATRGTWTGTHRGDFMGIPATGKRVSVTYSDVWRLENGKAVENWVQMDMLGLMQQLGVAPAPGQ